MVIVLCGEAPMKEYRPMVSVVAADSKRKERGEEELCYHILSLAL